MSSTSTSSRTCGCGTRPTASSRSRPGYQCASVASCNEWKNPSNYHWKTDTPENVDYGTVADAIRLSEAVIRKLDERWI